ncbi:DUF6262 family protein [Nocardia pseudovaccinii]|uniref:DUF6262 family protein n=1 Tax=Nocardia pseudovaccinii TaxID=189540 RepID=UPI003D8C9EBD
MRADNSAAIVIAAHRRRELTRAKAIQALRELERTGAPVTFQSVATAAAVSRSWLYNQPDIRIEIERLRPLTSRTTSAEIPASQRISESSILTRLNAALQRNRELAEENQRLRRQLAHALGDQRHTPNPEDQPRRATNRSRHSSITIGPC